MDDNSWISILYIALAVIILIESVAVHVALNKIIEADIDAALQRRGKVRIKLVSSRNGSLFIDVVCIAVVFIILGFLLHWGLSASITLLLYDLLHTIVLITMSIVLFRWRYRGFKCSTNGNASYKKCFWRSGNEANIPLAGSHEDNTLSGLNPTLNTASAFSHNCEQLQGK